MGGRNPEELLEISPSLKPPKQAMADRAQAARTDQTEDVRPLHARGRESLLRRNSLKAVGPSRCGRQGGYAGAGYAGAGGPCKSTHDINGAAAQQGSSVRASCGELSWSGNSRKPPDEDLREKVLPSPHPADADELISAVAFPEMPGAPAPRANAIQTPN